MQRCIDLAILGKGNVAPNPMVGAVLIAEDNIIGEGWHEEYGKAHAEVNCINAVKSEHQHLISQSTLYVSLEPCNHYGKTPPCSHLIIQNKIPKVIIGSQDPFPKVNGSGIQFLRENGVEVEIGILEDQCKKLNKIFFTNQQLNRPYIILKWAESLDGFIGSGNKESIAISNPYTQRWVHKMRRELSGILVGHNTWLLDQPKLDNRFYFGKPPVKFVLSDEHFSGIKSISKDSILQAKKEQDLLSLFGINSLLIEGGKDTLQFFIDNDLWDEAFQITSKTLLEKGVESPFLTNKKRIESFEISHDSIDHYVNVHNRFYL